MSTIRVSMLSLASKKGAAPFVDKAAQARQNLVALKKTVREVAQDDGPMTAVAFARNLFGSYFKLKK